MKYSKVITIFLFNLFIIASVNAQANINKTILQYKDSNLTDGSVDVILITGNKYLKLLYDSSVLISWKYGDCHLNNKGKYVLHPKNCEGAFFDYYKVKDKKHKFYYMSNVRLLYKTQKRRDIEELSLVLRNGYDTNGKKRPIDIRYSIYPSNADSAGVLRVVKQKYIYKYTLKDTDTINLAGCSGFINLGLNDLDTNIRVKRNESVFCCLLFNNQKYSTPFGIKAHSFQLEYDSEKFKPLNFDIYNKYIRDIANYIDP